VPTQAEAAFNEFKEKYAEMLAFSRELKIDDVFALATPLAAEQIKSP